MQLREYLKKPEQSQQRFADRMGVSQGLVSQWLNWLDGKAKNASKIHPETAVRIEAASDGDVTCEELNQVGIEFERVDGKVTHFRIEAPVLDQAQAA